MNVESDYTEWINPQKNHVRHLRPPETRKHAHYSSQNNPFQNRKKPSLYRIGDVVTYHDADGNPIDVRFEQFEVKQEHKQFRSTWGYPMQILVVPAFVVDVVTFPFQFFAVTQSLKTTH
jgi:hypothetical protein